jgi:hypothetical protein
MRHIGELEAAQVQIDAAIDGRARVEEARIRRRAVLLGEDEQHREHRALAHEAGVLAVSVAQGGAKEERRLVPGDRPRGGRRRRERLQHRLERLLEAAAALADVGHAPDVPREVLGRDALTGREAQHARVLRAAAGDGGAPARGEQTVVPEVVAERAVPAGRHVEAAAAHVAGDHADVERRDGIEVGDAVAVSVAADQGTNEARDLDREARELLAHAARVLDREEQIELVGVGRADARATALAARAREALAADQGRCLVDQPVAVVVEEVAVLTARIARAVRVGGLRGAAPARETVAVRGARRSAAAGHTQPGATVRVLRAPLARRGPQIPARRARRQHEPQPDDQDPLHRSPPRTHRVRRRVARCFPTASERDRAARPDRSGPAERLDARAHLEDRVGALEHA